MVPELARVLAWVASCLILGCIALLISADPGTAAVDASDGPALYGP